MGSSGENSEGISWRDWSQESFDEASKKGQLVLLDLFAPWCHWCHVMDEKTYSDADIIKTINENFVPVRVDIDGRPDVSERYNRGGFPSTVFLSERGEVIWGATYVPPNDMKRVMEQILASKSSGEIEMALERDRMQFLDVSKGLERREQVEPSFVEGVFEDIFATYDVEWGGFGTDQKFPHADVLDLLLFKHAENDDRELSVAVANTLDKMTEGLYDRIAGGIFRYSVTRNWKTPHYEKMLETNLGFLRNLAHASLILGQGRFAETAEGVASYLFTTLRDEAAGGFFSSQDADEKYYNLSRVERAKSPAPKVVRDIYAGWNCEAASTLIEAGVLLDRKDWVKLGQDAWGCSLRQHWDPGRALVRHREGQELYLLEDQVSFLEALIAVLELAPEDEMRELLDMGERLIGAVDKTFAHPEGGYGDVLTGKDSIGELAEPRMPIVANTKWARSLALFSVADFKPELAEAGWRVLKSFHPKQLQANGVFAAPYVLAWWVLENGPQLVEIHGTNGGDLPNEPLWTSAKKAIYPGTVVMRARRVGPEVSRPSRPFAVVCRSTGCSKEIEDPKALMKIIKGKAQVNSK